MRDMFPGFYRPTEEEFKKLWQECIFSFDANVLLNIYRYSPATTENFFSILEQLHERVWIPHQVALEYQKNRLNVISEQTDISDELVKTIQAKLDQLKKRHPFIPVEDLHNMFADVVEKSVSAIEEAKENYPDLLSEDTLRERLTQLLEGKVGSPYSESELTKNQEKAKQRYEKQQPPGYKDQKKDTLYGDAILWFQLLDHVQSTKRPLIFVTNDQKEDWWEKYHGKTIGPRPELIREMLDVAGVQFYMYSYENFLAYAEKYLRIEVLPEVTEEVQAVESGRLLQETEDLVKEYRRSVLDGVLNQQMRDSMLVDNTMQGSIKDALASMQAHQVGMSSAIGEMQAFLKPLGLNDMFPSALGSLSPDEFSAIQGLSMTDVLRTPAIADVLANMRTPAIADVLADIRTSLDETQALLKSFSALDIQKQVALLDDQTSGSDGDDQNQ